MGDVRGGGRAAPGSWHLGAALRFGPASFIAVDPDGNRIVVDHDV